VAADSFGEAIDESLIFLPGKLRKCVVGRHGKRDDILLSVFVRNPHASPANQGIFCLFCPCPKLG
jgi:hypothetical protein